MSKPQFYLKQSGNELGATYVDILREASNYGGEKAKHLIGRLMDIADRVGMEMGDEGAEWFLVTLGGVTFGWNPDDGWDPDPVEQLALMVRGYQHADADFAEKTEAVNVLSATAEHLADLLYVISISTETAGSDEGCEQFNALLQNVHEFLDKASLLEGCVQRFRANLEAANGK